MKIRLALCILTGVILGGCATVNLARLPAEVSRIELVGISSSKLTVRTPEFREEASRLELDGVVVMGVRADTTEHTRLTVSFYNQAGHILQSTELDFSPRKLVWLPHAAFHRGSYRLPLSSLPVGTVRIEVRAHE